MRIPLVQRSYRRFAKFWAAFHGARKARADMARHMRVVLRAALEKDKK